MVKRMLIHLKRNDHVKHRYFNLELFFGSYIFHYICTIHFTHFCAQVATTNILVLLPRVNLRLYANYAFPFYFPLSAITVKNIPMSAELLYRKRIVILQSNTVGKHKLATYGITVIRLVECFNRYCYPFRYF